MRGPRWQPQTIVGLTICIYVGASDAYGVLDYGGLIGVRGKAGAAMTHCILLPWGYLI